MSPSREGRSHPRQEEPIVPIPSVRLSSAHDPATTLSEQLRHAVALRWQAVLDYREGMASRGEAVLFAHFDERLDRLIRLAGTPIGGEVVILGRDSATGRRWTAVPGEGVPARNGDTVLHFDGGDLEAWQVCGRYRRITTASHPATPTELVHVLHRLDALGG
jgi:hypothetical protein